MINFLHSLFGVDFKQGSYPESLVKKAIERAVDGTDLWLRAVSGYRKKLRPSVLQQLKRQAFDHLLSQALKRITATKVEQEKLARYRKLFKSKLELLRRPLPALQHSVILP